MSFHGGFRGGFTRGFQSLERREQEREQEEQERTRRERERKEMLFGYPQARERFEEWRRRELERLERERERIEREREEERRERPRRKRNQLKPYRLTRKLLDQKREQKLQQAQALKELASRPPVAIRPTGDAATEEEEFRPWRLRYPGYRPVSPESDDEYFPECFPLDLTPEIQAQLGLNWMDRVPDHQWISTGELMRQLEWNQQWKWKRSS